MLVSLIFITTYSAYSGNTHASDILILTPEDAEQSHRTLMAAINSQMMDYNLTAELQLLDEPLSTKQSPLEIAQQFHMLTDKLAIFWIQNDSFYLYIHDGEDNHFFSRPLPEASSNAAQQNWELQCDAIASVVHAVMSSWIAPVDQTEMIPLPPSENSPPEEALPEESRSSEIEAQSVDNNEPLPPFIESRPFRISLGLMYEGHVMSSDNPWVHGAGLMLHLRLKEMLLIGLEPGFATLSNASFRLTRVPIRLKCGVRFDRYRFTFGIDANIYIDFTRVRGPQSTPISQADVRYPGLGVAGSAAFHLNQRFSLVAQFGLDISSASNIYWNNDEAIFYYGPFQGRLGAGIIFRI